MDALTAAIFSFVTSHPSGVDEDEIRLHVEALEDDVYNLGNYLTILWKLVQSDRLTWRLPDGVAEDSPEAGSVPLVYQVAPPPSTPGAK